MRLKSTRGSEASVEWTREDTNSMAIGHVESDGECSNIVGVDYIGIKRRIPNCQGMAALVGQFGMVDKKQTR